MPLLNTKFHHQPVMLNYLLNNIVPPLAKNALDATLGEGGHSKGLLEKNLHVWAIERDEEIASKAAQRLHSYIKKNSFSIVFGNYGNSKLSVFSKPLKFDFILFDLGVSKFHYFASGRGFSFASSEPLDMRLEKNIKLSAAEVINFYSEEKLADVFYHFGEMTNAKVMAKHICKQRKKLVINTSSQLAEIIKAGPHYCYGGNHPATQAFQALRVYVNKELEHIESGIKNAIKCLNLGGRLAVISYHSLEDRIVKKTFHKFLIKRENKNKYAHLKKNSNNPISNFNIQNTKKKLNTNETPQSYNNNSLQNNKLPKFSLFAKKAIVATREEVLENRAARSAKLRVLEAN